MSAQNDKFVFPENQQSDLNKQQLVFEVAGTPKELYHKTINFFRKKIPITHVLFFLTKEEGETLKVETNSKLYKWQGIKTCTSYQVEFEFKQDQIGGFSAKFDDWKLRHTRNVFLQLYSQTKRSH